MASSKEYLQFILGQLAEFINSVTDSLFIIRLSRNTVFNSSGTTVSGFLGALVAGFVAGYIVLLQERYSKTS